MKRYTDGEKEQTVQRNPVEQGQKDRRSKQLGRQAASTREEGRSLRSLSKLLREY